MVGPKVSVLLAVHNGLPHVAKAIESILQQTLEDFEFIIVDDGSTDDTNSVLTAAARGDSRIRVIRNDRCYGLASSLNRGIHYAQAEWVARMDADDLALSDRLAKQWAFVKQSTDVDILGSQALDIDGTGRVIANRTVPTRHEEIRRWLPFLNPMIHPTVMFRKARVVGVGGYRSHLRYVQDYDLWFRCMAAGGRFANLPEPLLMYRTDEGHYRKYGLAYRLTDARVRANGCRLLRCRLAEWSGVAAPFVTWLLPRQLKLRARGWVRSR